MKRDNVKSTLAKSRAESYSYNILKMVAHSIQPYASLITSVIRNVVNWCNIGDVTIWNGASKNKELTIQAELKLHLELFGTRIVSVKK